jgi:membrane protease YdiL (CAAX protease family)
VLDPEGTAAWNARRSSADPAVDTRRGDLPVEPFGGACNARSHDAPEDAGEAAAPVRGRLLSLLEVIACSPFVTQLGVGVVLALVGLPMFASSGRLSLAYIVWLSLIDTVLVVTLVVAFLRARGERPAATFLGTRTIAREAALGLLLLPVAFALIVVTAQLIQLVAPWLKSPLGNPLADLLRTRTGTAVFALVAMLAGGVREELQRAFVLHRFEQHLGGAALGIVIFSIVFGLGHVLQGWDATVLTGLLGAFWGVVYLWRRSVVAPAVCHAVFNLVEVVSHGLQA